MRCKVFSDRSVTVARMLWEHLVRVQISAVRQKAKPFWGVPRFEHVGSRGKRNFPVEEIIQNRGFWKRNEFVSWRRVSSEILGGPTWNKEWAGKLLCLRPDLKVGDM